MTTKRLLVWIIRTQFLVHLALLIDRAPLACIFMGLGSHVAYLRLLKQFPYMRLTSVEGLTSCMFFLLSNILWIRYFWTSYYSVEYIASFLFVTTWIIPLTLFLGLAGEQSALPGAGGYPYSTQQQSRSTSMHAMGGSSYTSDRHNGQNYHRARRGFALRIFDLLRRKRDEVLPDAISKLPASSGLFKEKL